MVTLDANHWDETICSMVACQHPPCWEARRRIEKGSPRILLSALASSSRESPDSEDELPTLKIINLPLNYSQRERIKFTESFGSLTNTISNIKDSRGCFSNSTLNDALVPRISTLSSEKNPFPGLNSRMESRTPHLTPVSFACLRQGEKIQVTDLNEFAVHRFGYHPANGNLVVRWIPDIQHRRLRPEKPAPGVVASAQRLCVRDLSLESILTFKERKETVPVKEKVPKRTPSQCKASLGGSVAWRHPMPVLREELSSPETPHMNGGGLPHKPQGSSETGIVPTSAEQCSRTRGGPVSLERTKTSRKLVECRGKTANLSSEGYDSYFSRVLQPQSKYNHYCKYFTGQKEALLTPSDIPACNRDCWSEEPAEKSEERQSLLRFPNPPPPPPSPLVSENSGLTESRQGLCVGSK